MQSKSTKLSKAAALLSVGLVITSFIMNNAEAAPTETCTIQSQGGTGCQKGPNCPVYEPNQGLVWDEHEICTYQSQTDPGTGVTTQRLVKDQLAGDCSSSVSGCCNNLDIVAHCPTGNKCPPTPPDGIVCQLSNS